MTSKKTPPPRDYLGELEQVVLLAVAHLQGEGYGMTVRREIEERAGRSTSVGALYSTLERLEEKGFVRSRTGPPSAERGGRAKRFFTVTASGMRALERSRRMVDAMWEGIPGASDTG
ncbi:MAG TPA: PadR family transcriptional regulator [Thermoanaerobaculia bacterium]|nr:PadR family transcriptional regulator [Thermoanaerobaculia bacterium]